MGQAQLGPVFVAGVPAPFATAPEVEWKETVADQIQAVWNKPHIEQPCEVTLVFALPEQKAAVTDLDNLLKPAIDAIGSVLFKPARTGHQVRWNADDHWIYRLVAEKRSEMNSERIGVEVTVKGYMSP